MSRLLVQFYQKLQMLRDIEQGQDLVEYALVVALVAFGATAGMGGLATGITHAFNSISSKLATTL